MEEPWHRLEGDRPGETLHTNLAASLATLVQPGVTALRTERATEVRSDTHRIVFLLTPWCRIRGELTACSPLIEAFKSGELERKDPQHPLLDAMAGLHNCHALLDWMKRGQAQHLVFDDKRTRSFYRAGAESSLLSNVITGATRRLAVAAALGRIGIPIYNITGEGNQHEFIVHRYSQGMLNEAGEPVTYDAKQLIDQLNDGTLQRQQPDHPFLVAYCARMNRERLLQHIDREAPLLLLTPDAVRKSGRYDAQGLHAYIHPNASGKTWDQVEKHFFG
jgi:hypothetical protein